MQASHACDPGSTPGVRILQAEEGTGWYCPRSWRLGILPFLNKVAAQRRVRTRAPAGGHGHWRCRWPGSAEVRGWDFPGEPKGHPFSGLGFANAISARSVAASYKPPMLVTRARLPACA